MGWAANDDEVRDTLRLQLSLLKTALYIPMRNLRNTVEQLTHKEKKEVLRAKLLAVDTALAEMEYHLER